MMLNSTIFKPDRKTITLIKLPLRTGRFQRAASAGVFYDKQVLPNT
jgi:hypothetical protein